jgi:hypothetical protein
MDPSLFNALLALAGVVVWGAFTYWAGSRLLRLGERREADRPRMP